jgi:hypothetical protein
MVIPNLDSNLASLQTIEAKLNPLALVIWEGKEMDYCDMEDLAKCIKQETKNFVPILGHNYSASCSATRMRGHARVSNTILVKAFLLGNKKTPSF